MTRRSVCLGLALAAVGLASRADDPAPAPKPDPAEAGIRAAVEGFRAAFAKGDAQAVAATFTEDAEIVDEEGLTTRGRKEIVDRFAELFKERPGETIDVRSESIRVLAPGVAIEEGRATVRDPKGNPVETTDFEAIHVLREGRWLQARVRDYAASITPHERLEPLAWLAGEWVDEGDGGLVTVSCKWSEDGGYLLRDFRLQRRGEPARTGTQRIGWDAAREQVRSWTFGSEGGHSEEAWSLDDEGRWIIKASAVLPDGRRATATNVLEKLGPDSARFASIDRTLGGEALPDSEAYLLVRRPAPPK